MNVHVQVFLYYKYLLSLGDRRVESWPLMTSPFPTIALTLSYLLVRTSLYNPLKGLVVIQSFLSSAALGLASCLVILPFL